MTWRFTYLPENGTGACLAREWKFSPNLKFPRASVLDLQTWTGWTDEQNRCYSEVLYDKKTTLQTVSYFCVLLWFKASVLALSVVTGACPTQQRSKKPPRFWSALRDCNPGIPKPGIRKKGAGLQSLCTLLFPLERSQISDRSQRGRPLALGMWRHDRLQFVSFCSEWFHN